MNEKNKIPTIKDVTKYIKLTNFDNVIVTKEIYDAVIEHYYKDKKKEFLKAIEGQYKQLNEWYRFENTGKCIPNYIDESYDDQKDIINELEMEFKKIFGE